MVLYSSSTTFENVLRDSPLSAERLTSLGQLLKDFWNREGEKTSMETHQEKPDSEIQAAVVPIESTLQVDLASSR